MSHATQACMHSLCCFVLEMIENLELLDVTVSVASLGCFIIRKMKSQVLFTLHP